MCWGFLVTWMPYAVVSMWSAYGDKASQIPIRLTAFAVLIAKSSVVVNPVIYVLMSKKFRPLLLNSLNISKIRMFSPTKTNDCKQWKFITDFIPIRSSACSTGSSNMYSDSVPSSEKCVVKITRHDEQTFCNEVQL